MESYKKPWESKTIIGLAVMVLGIVVKQFAFPISEAEIVSVVAYLCEGIGGILVFVGRIKAEKKVSL